MIPYKCPVATFNLLSTDLPERGNVAHIDKRFSILTQRLLPPHMEDGCILCLQEVSRKWAAWLEPWFRSRGYDWSVVHYSGHSMGVAIAYPTKRYTCQKQIVNKISNTIDRVCSYHPHLHPRRSPVQWICWAMRCLVCFLLFSLLACIGFLLWIASACARCGSGTNSGSGFTTRVQTVRQRCWTMRQSLKESCCLLLLTPYTRAMRLQNLMLTLFLEHLPTHETICLSTYHMPCRFWDPDVMRIHVTAAFWQARQCAWSDPRIDCLVLAGDWNIKPKDVLYQYMSGRGLVWPIGTWRRGRPVLLSADDTINNSKSKNANRRSSGSPVCVPAMHSAFYEATGDEPRYTCRNDTTGFCETLDYIWFLVNIARDDKREQRRIHGRTRWKWKCNSVQECSDADVRDTSDHILIRANFLLCPSSSSSPPP